MGLPKDIHTGVFFGKLITSAALRQACMCVMLPDFVVDMSIMCTLTNNRVFSVHR